MKETDFEKLKIVRTGIRLNEINQDYRYRISTARNGCCYMLIELQDLDGTAKNVQTRFYPSKSLKSLVDTSNAEALLDFIETHKDKICLRVFINGESHYLRFYLRKDKTLIKKSLPKLETLTFDKNNLIIKPL